MTFGDVSDIYFNKGLEMFKKNDLSNAIQTFYKSIDFNENNWRCLNVIGLCLYKLGRFNEARAAWMRSYNINKYEENQAQVYLSSLEKEDFKEMINSVNRALEFSENRNYKKAIKVLKKDNIRGYSIVSIGNLYGLCSYGMGRRIEALSAWKEVLSIDIGNCDAINYIIGAGTYKSDKKDLFGWLKKTFGSNKE